jgi:hypothetical protein
MNLPFTRPPCFPYAFQAGYAKGKGERQQPGSNAESLYAQPFADRYSSDLCVVLYETVG